MRKIVSVNKKIFCKDVCNNLLQASKVNRLLLLFSKKNKNTVHYLCKELLKIIMIKIIML